MSASTTLWPNGARIAVATTIMFETYMPGVAPKYSVQTTPLKAGTIDHAGIAWSSFGGRTGIWRIVNTLDRLGIPATVMANSRCVEEFPEAMQQFLGLPWTTRSGARYCGTTARVFMVSPVRQPH